MRIIQREKANYANGLYNLSQTDIEPQKDKTHIYEGKTQKLSAARRCHLQGAMMEFKLK